MPSERPPCPMCRLLAMPKEAEDADRLTHSWALGFFYGGICTHGAPLNLCNQHFRVLRGVADTLGIRFVTDADIHDSDGTVH